MTNITSRLRLIEGNPPIRCQDSNECPYKEIHVLRGGANGMDKTPLRHIYGGVPFLEKLDIK